MSDRRDFLAAMAAGSLAAFPRTNAPSATAGAATAEYQGRGDYLFSPGLTYLSTATMGPCSRAVVDATMRAWHELESNPQFMGYAGATLQAAERVRQQAADLLGCSADEIMITRSTTDGMNAVAQGLRLPAGQRVLTTDQEHEGGLAGWQYLASRHGVALDVVPIPHGENDAPAVVARLAAALTPATRVIVVSDILSSTGFRMPIAEISALARSRGVLCVVDGAQSAGGIAVNVRELGCHAYVTSGHKWLMGPKGTGLLYIASEAAPVIDPMQFHDGRAYYNHSTGVGNLPGAVGLGVAIEHLRSTGIAAVERHNMSLRNRLYEGLTRIPSVTVVSPAPGPQASPLVTFRLPERLDSQVLVSRLRDAHQLIVKMVPKRWMNGIRPSPHIFNTAREVDRLLAVLGQEVA